MELIGHPGIRILLILLFLFVFLGATLVAPECEPFPAAPGLERIGICRVSTWVKACLDPKKVVYINPTIKPQLFTTLKATLEADFTDWTVVAGDTLPGKFSLITGNPLDVNYNHRMVLPITTNTGNLLTDVGNKTIAKAQIVVDYQDTIFVRNLLGIIICGSIIFYLTYFVLMNKTT